MFRDLKREKEIVSVWYSYVCGKAGEVSKD